MVDLADTAIGSAGTMVQIHQLASEGVEAARVLDGMAVEVG